MRGIPGAKTALSMLKRFFRRTKAVFTWLSVVLVLENSGVPVFSQTLEPTVTTGEQVLAIYRKIRQMEGLVVLW